MTQQAIELRHPLAAKVSLPRLVMLPDAQRSAQSEAVSLPPGCLVLHSLAAAVHSPRPTPVSAAPEAVCSSHPRLPRARRGRPFTCTVTAA
jgi:hypothetical protein